MKLKTFCVTGSGQFPFDMLRYDSCWPKTSNDSLKLEGTIRETRTIEMETVSSFDLTPERWSSFGWQIEKGAGHGK